MANPVNFNVGKLDYDGIVQSLRDYLSYQTELRDYNFQGSALSTLINLLAYNTHYNAVYDNFALNEAFLDSAHKRESVISHASMLNYIPRSAKGSTAVVDISVYDDDFDSTLSSVTLPKYSVFTTAVNGVDYTFYTNSAYTLARSNSTFTATGVTLHQGTYITIQRTYAGDRYQRIILDNENVDIDSIDVRVLHDQTVYTFTRAENIIDINDTSRVYFLTTDSRGHYQIEFGSGILGYALSSGDVITITYLTVGSDPTGPNGASVFAYQGTLSSIGFSNNATMSIITTTRAQGGCEPESTESIRFLAPKMFTTQDRCITANDYKTMILKNFDFVRSVNVWGGQDNDPPQYGKVFISIIPEQGQTITAYQQQSIESLLQSKKELTKLIEFVDPQYLNIIIDSTVHYRSSVSTNTSTDIENIVRNTINSYDDANLRDFGTILRFSQLSEQIDSCESSIVSNTTKMMLSIDVDPVYDSSYSYNIEFNNQIYQTSCASDCVSSTGFYCTAGGEDRVCYIDDDPTTSSIRLYYRDDSDNKVILSTIGTINYTTGSITLNDLNISSVENGTWTITINPASYDVISSRNQFAVIDDNQLTIDVIDDDQQTSYVQTSIK